MRTLATRAKRGRFNEVSMWPFISFLILVVLLALVVLAFLFKGNVSTDRLSMVYYEDGLWELYAGLILLLLGIAE